MKLLIDMNLSPNWVEVFKRHNWEALHWYSVGDPRATDRAIMDWARVNGYVVFTHDLDFGTLLATTQAIGPSVIQVRTQDVLPSYLESKIVSILRQYETMLEKGALITVDEPIQGAYLPFQITTNRRFQPTCLMHRVPKLLSRGYHSLERKSLRNNRPAVEARR